MTTMTVITNNNKKNNKKVYVDANFFFENGYESPSYKITKPKDILKFVQELEERNAKEKQRKAEEKRLEKLRVKEEKRLERLRIKEEEKRLEKERLRAEESKRIFSTITIKHKESVKYLVSDVEGTPIAITSTKTNLYKYLNTNSNNIALRRHLNGNKATFAHMDIEGNEQHFIIEVIPESVGTDLLEVLDYLGLLDEHVGRYTEIQVM